ncbi:MAG: NAD(P) transhydrogenase subunit alpha [Eubacteriales bacterium]|nr:NAD(P) transhydrogenase subunit alpha [Eubacteriales bacterium]
MENEISKLTLVLIFCVSAIIGYFIISGVPSLLHTPLMSGMNALSGITILGALAAFAGTVRSGGRILACTAVLAATVNIVGGFGVTGRMLRMFKNTRGNMSRAGKKAEITNSTE